jgi:hypothetical protein
VKLGRSKVIGRRGIVPGLVLLSLSFVGCSLFMPWGAFYQGPGKYEKLNGVWRVVLGSVSLAQENRAAATFTHLGPRWSWAVLLRLEPPMPITEDGRANSILRLRLRNERSETVFDHDGSLANWEWAGDRILLAGQSSEVPLKGGGVEITPVGVGIDGGWGTYFKPRYDGIYTLTCEVLRGDPRFKGFRADIVLETYLGSL